MKFSIHTLKEQKRSITDIRNFLSLALPYLNSSIHRQALRFLYNHTSFCKLEKRSTLFSSEKSRRRTDIIIVTSGLVNGYTTEAYDQGVWVGIKGSIFVCDLDACMDFNVRAAEPSSLMVIDGRALEKGCQRHPILLLIFFNLLFPHTMRGYDSRTPLHEKENTSERLAYFRQTYPWMIGELEGIKVIEQIRHQYG